MTSHAHDHGPAHADASRAFAIGLLLNAAFIVVEIASGVLAGSIALISDGLHNVGDAFGLALSFIAVRLATRVGTLRRTYGLRRATILAALANALLLLGGVVFIAIEAVDALRDGTQAHGGAMIVVAGIGVAVNAGSAWLFARARRRDVNARSAFLHLASDAAVSAAVVLAGVAILVTGWTWLDPALSIAVAAVVVVSTWPLLREALDLALDAVPPRIDPTRIHTYLAHLDGVAAVHDLHVWPLSTTETALTVHLVAGEGDAEPDLALVARTLASEFDVQHATIQIERADRAVDCIARRCSVR